MIRWQEYGIWGTRQMPCEGRSCQLSYISPNIAFFCPSLFSTLTTSKHSLHALSAFSLPLQSGSGGGGGEVLCRQRKLWQQIILSAHQQRQRCLPKPPKQKYLYCKSLNYLPEIQCGRWLWFQTCFQGQWLARGRVSKTVEHDSGLIISTQASQENPIKSELQMYHTD